MAQPIDARIGLTSLDDDISRQCKVAI